MNAQVSADSKTDDDDDDEETARLASSAPCAIFDFNSVLTTSC